MIETLSHPAQSAEFLSRLHDGELSSAEAAAFESHRRECAECRAAVAEFEGALAAYRSAPVPPHASDLSARILRKIRAASPSRRPFGVMFGIDVRWAGALAAALLVVIIGAPVFRRAPQDKRAVPPATSLPGPIPAYVLDAEEERPKQKQNEANRAPRKEAAPKAEAAPPKSAADDATASGRDLDQFAEPREGARESLERRDEIAATNADKKDAAATLEADAAQEPAAPTLQAAAPPAETKDLAKSTTARRQSAAAPVGGEAGTGASADEPPLVVRVTIHAIDGEGEAPEVARTPSDDRLAALRGRKYVLIVEAGGRVVAVEERPAGRKPAGDKAREADERRAARLRPLAESILREIAFQPGDRSRRLVVSIE